MTALLDFDLAHGQAVLQKFADLVATTPDFVGMLREDEQRDFTAVLREVIDLSTVGLVFLHGRNNLRKDGVAGQEVAKRSGASLIAWAKGSQPATVVWTLAGMIAATSVSVLERFFRHGTPRLTGEEIRKVNPKSGRGFEGWLRELSRHGCALDPAVVAVLRNLLTERNEFIHDRQPLPEKLDNAYIERAAVAMSAWPNAVALCARSFLEAMVAHRGTSLV